jgi:hypothetical protein
LRSSLNLPRIDDRLVKEQVDFREAGETGANLVWDFSTLRTLDERTVRYFSRNDADLVCAENDRLVYYRYAGDSLLLSGLENPNDLLHYQQPGLLLKFPLACGSLTESAYSGRGKHGDLLVSTVRGTLHTTADACGSLILPTGDTLYNVMRVHIRQTENTVYFPASSGFDINLPPAADETAQSSPDLITTDTYQWYVEGYRYPVFETLTACRILDGKQIPLRRESFLYHPEEQAGLPEDPANQAVLAENRAAREAKLHLDRAELLSLHYYPNPVRDKLTVELTAAPNLPVQILLHDVQGRLVYRATKENPSGRISASIDLHAYPKGNYLLSVHAGKENSSKKIIKH